MGDSLLDPKTWSWSYTPSKIKLSLDKIGSPMFDQSRDDKYWKSLLRSDNFEIKFKDGLVIEKSQISYIDVDRENGKLVLTLKKGTLVGIIGVDQKNVDIDKLKFPSIISYLDSDNENKIKKVHKDVIRKLMLEYGAPSSLTFMMVTCSVLSKEKIEIYMMSSDEVSFAEVVKFSESVKIKGV